ncbi:MAG TPA: sulfotransferase domain-containing protein [Enhygromyxa sp.]|nr:sulfotransferase domain-containing protein [Enhygromyxa sp.]
MSEQAPAGKIWLDPEIQQKIRWREGDIVVSVPPKSGTTWTMNIVHQLRTGGDPDFADIYAEVPWLEFVEHPRRTAEEVVARIDSMPADRRRAFKSHSAPPMLPYLDDVKYVVIVRNPEEAIASLEPFMRQHTAEWLELWQIPRAAFVQPDFESFYTKSLVAEALPAMFFGFMAQWWPLRQRDNVLLLHFADMKRDHEGSVRKIASFLGLEPSAEQWPTILEHTSFAWMKQHDRKFDATTITEVPFWYPGAMVRHGRVGAAREDGVTEAIARDLAARGRELLQDEAAFEWLYHGGSAR